MPFRVARGLPRFHPDLSARRDSVRGCPELTVPADDPARIVHEFIHTKDFRVQEQAHSALGRKPVHPRFKLGPWLYGSLIGVHEAKALARLTKTDLAMRLVSGGHEMSRSTLKNYRMENADFFAECMKWTVTEAISVGAGRPDQAGRGQRADPRGRVAQEHPHAGAVEKTLGGTGESGPLIAR